MSSVQTERLEALLDSHNAADRAELKTALARLAAEISTRSKVSSQGSFDFFCSSLKALKRFRGTLYADLRFQCLADTSSYFYQAGFIQKAIDAASLLCELAALSGSPVWLRKAYTYSGVMHADVGNVGQALQDYARALELCRQLKDETSMARVLLNTGVAFNYAGLYQEAIACFQRASSLAAPPYGDEAILKSSLSNHAQSLLYLERFQDGFKIAEEALTGLPPPTTGAEVVSRIVKEFTFVQLALEVGNLKAARAHSRTCLELARSNESVRSKALADITMALCEVYGGKVDRGLERLEHALQNSAPTDPWWRSALIALVKSYDISGDHSRALHHMRVLLDHLRAQREQSLSALLPLRDGSEQLATRDLQALELREARLVARVAEAESQWKCAEMLERMAIAADLKEDQSGEHGYRVGRLAASLAQLVGWSEDKTTELDVAARLHDIGKMAMPDRILLNSAELRAAERHFMSTHTTIGAELLGKSNIPQLRMAEEIARYHHEWWNGEGYPSSLKGKRIPIHARIVALADVFDALTHGRPFSPAWPIDKALAEISARKGTQFDPELTDLFLALIERLRNEHEDLDEYLGRAGKTSPFLQARARIRQMLAEEREHERKATVTGNETRH